MRIRLHRSGKRKNRTPLRLRLLLAGSVCVLVFCVSGLVRYAVNASRSAGISRSFQEIYYGEPQREEDPQAPAQRSPAMRRFEVVFPKADAGNPAASATQIPYAVGWPGNPAMTVSAALKKLQRQNGDIVGWLSIPGTLEQAVVQRDNTYYLKRDYLGYHNANGSLFLEEGISLKSRPDTFIIFGHNMQTGDMFGCLRLYEDPGYYRRHAVIAFDALYEDGTYVVFSVADVDTVRGTLRYVPFMQLPGMEKDLRADSIRKLQAFSRIDSPVQVGPDDQLLLLVTCEGTDSSRRVVAARRLRDGETPETVRMGLESAKKRN